MEKKLGNLVETGSASQREVVMPSPSMERPGLDSHELPEKLLDPQVQSAVAQTLATGAALPDVPTAQPKSKGSPVINTSAEFDPSWVMRMKAILAKVRNNPKGKVEALDKLKAEYKKSRFNHESPLKGEKAAKS